MRCVLGDFVFSLKCTHKQCIFELTPVSLSFSHLNMDFKLSETNPGNKCIILMTTNFVYEKPLKVVFLIGDVQLNPVKNL